MSRSFLPTSRSFNDSLCPRQEGGALVTSGLRRLASPADKAEDGPASGGTGARGHQTRAAPRGAIEDLMLVSVAHVVIGLREPGEWEL